MGGGEGFPVSVTLGVLGVGNGERRGRRTGHEGQTELVAAGLAEDEALAGELGQGVAEGGGTHGTELAQLGHRDGPIQTGQRVPNPLDRSRGRGGWWVGRGPEDRKGEGRTVLSQLEGEGIGGGGGPVLGGEGEGLLVAAEVEIGVAPAVEFARTAQGLAGPGGVGILAGMVHDEHGELELTLELTQEAQERGDLGGFVLVDAMETDQGIEHEQAGTTLRDGPFQTPAVGGQVQAQARGGDDIDREGGEVDAGGGTDAEQALADDGVGVLGGKEEHRAGKDGAEPAEAEGSGGDADGQVEGEEAFAALGFAPEDADGLVAPEILDEPGGEATVVLGKLAGALNREGGVHGRLVRGLGSEAKTSK